ncbi:MAG: hypothetical protein JXR64_07650 [Spirochaetales bacterium]|nr:hypothetical protein [Spirochaetales bacterium]
MALKDEFPSVNYYDQDFVDIYDRTWAWSIDFENKGNNANGINEYFTHPDNKTINLFETCMSSFFLVYSNKNYDVSIYLDNFYKKQESNGAIRSDYSLETGKPVFTQDNPEGLNPPLFAWVEYNLYHKVGQKKRIKDIMPYLEKYYTWLDDNFRMENGLYSVPLSATTMVNSPRKDAYYMIDFNCQVAMSCLYMSALGDVLNDKEISFRYKKRFFSLKTRISTKMWCDEDGFYYDLDKNENMIKEKTIASYWSLLAELPNEEKLEKLKNHLVDPNEFGTDNTFPTLSVSSQYFDENGNGYCGSVYPYFTFMVIKGLEKYNEYELARESAIKHLYFILDTFHPENGQKGSLWEAYKPFKDGPASCWDGNSYKSLYLPATGISTIALMIENIVGLCISLPRKTVDWIVPTLELMGISDLSLKRNMITILSNKTNRGWEIRLESEKLYYFTFDLIGTKKKTLPIPSGKCSMLIDKL